MIESQIIDGQEAAVMYLTDAFEPTDKDSAKLVKVVFDDGRTLWLVPQADEDD